MSLSTYPGEVFANTADFDTGIRLLLPHYEGMLKAIAHCLPTTATHILELGCGTGELSLKVLHQCPSAQLIAMDYSPRMLSYAQAKVQAAGCTERVTWVEADFGNWAEGGVEALQGAEFDACVSSLAIHHLSDAMKLCLFQRIHQSLKPNGCFWNADPILPESPALADVYRSVGEEWAAQHGTTLAEVRAKMGSRDSHGHSSHDHLATLIAHLNMLTQAGFHSLDVPWKYYGWAVFGGFS
jgi:trans-aconitate 2-methyltransferase